MGSLGLGFARVLIEITNPDASVTTVEFPRIKLDGESGVVVRTVEEKDIRFKEILPPTPEYELELEVYGRLISVGERNAETVYTLTHKDAEVES